MAALLNIFAEKVWEMFNLQLNFVIIVSNFFHVYQITQNHNLNKQMMCGKPLYIFDQIYVFVLFFL